MIESLNIKWFYAIGFAFLAFFLTGAYFDNLFIAAMPVVLLGIWLILMKPRGCYILRYFQFH